MQPRDRHGNILKEGDPVAFGIAFGQIASGRVTKVSNIVTNPDPNAPAGAVEITFSLNLPVHAPQGVVLEAVALKVPAVIGE